jgi:(S)-ureidoglycine aminohydrolase
VQQLGHTRSVLRPDHLLQTPETFVRAALPGMRHAQAIVHMSRAGGAGFVMYTAEFEAGGSLEPCPDQRFLYVLEGLLGVGEDRLGPGWFGYLAPGATAPIVSANGARAVVIEKPYEALAGQSIPNTVVGAEVDIVPTALGGDPWLEVRALVPDDPAFDFRVNTMTYAPGAALPHVEIHVMEHGLLMLEGGGIYRLSDRWYPVTAGDVIWMGPYCPQWFGAIGKAPAKYLIYKDWDRHPR